MSYSLAGEANLVSLEPELAVEVKLESLGRILMKVEITPDYMTQSHIFEFELDQSYLAALIENCRAVLEKYPIKGKPDVETET